MTNESNGHAVPQQPQPVLGRVEIDIHPQGVSLRTSTPHDEALAYVLTQALMAVTQRLTAQKLERNRKAQGPKIEVAGADQIPPPPDRQVV